MSRLDKKLHRLWHFKVGINLLWNTSQIVTKVNFQMFINFLVDHSNQLLKHVMELKQ